jgi:hypothetical protein
MNLNWNNLKTDPLPQNEPFSVPEDQDWRHLMATDVDGEVKVEWGKTWVASLDLEVEWRSGDGFDGARGA